LLVFGWRTAVLGLVSVQALVGAVALIGAAHNRTANRTLAGLLLVVVGLLTPYTIGFAGFYDAWPWLSFAPFALPLLVGPMAYGYTHALATGRAPRGFALHLAPGAAHLVYQTVCFCLPLAVKSAWDDKVHVPFVDPVVSLATLVSIGAYAWLSLRLLRRYRAVLADAVSDEGRYAAKWLRASLIALVTVLAVWTGYQVWEMVFGHLSYLNSFGLYLVLSALALYLAAEGWRHAELRFPHLLDENVAPEPPAEGRASSKDWAALGEQWAARVRTEGWWRDPELSLATLAAMLGVNTGYLSRGLNEGLGVNFAAFVNSLRARAVAKALAAGRSDDLLSLALESGFNSKASFNRAFRAEFGQSPSDYRRAHVSNRENPTREANLQRSADDAGT
jgi:AraC-like DNA-binding protein